MAESEHLVTSSQIAPVTPIQRRYMIVVELEESECSSPNQASPEPSIAGRQSNTFASYVRMVESKHFVATKSKSACPSYSAPVHDSR